MFDLNATDGSVRKHAYKSPVPETGEPPKADGATPAELDSEEMQEQHKRLLNIYVTEVDRQRENRAQMALDEDFYDNEQWSEEDKATLENRGQDALVYNVIASTVDWVTGTERRGRSDYKVQPRRKEGGKPAERKTSLLKYLSDVNRSPFEVSYSFEESVKAGMGWIEDAIDDDGDEEPIVRRHESWRFMHFDSLCTRLDLVDARFVTRSKWIDYDVGIGLFPKRQAVLEQSAEQADQFVDLDLYGDEAMDSQENEHREQSNSRSSLNFGYERDRVRAIEMWYRKPVEAHRLRGSEFSGEVFDPYSPGHQHAVRTGDADVTTSRMMRMHCALFTPQGMLWHGPSPYRHNRFPFTPIWAYRRSKTGLPYGMIRRLRDLQTDVNKRASKALHIISTNKVIMDDNALPDDVSIDEFLEEISRPDAVIQKRPASQIDINADRELAPAHLELMSRSISMIQSASGVTDENLGRRTNAVSGVAIGRRQDQGALATMKLFDNLRLALQLSGEKQLSLTEQFMTERKQFRITNSRGTPEFITINDDLPDNDITRTKADFIIGEQEWQATMREAAAMELMELTRSLPPAVALALIDLVVENMDLKNRDEIVKRIRQMTGQRDPDADEITPEEQAAIDEQTANAQLQRAAAESEIVKRLAEAQRATAQARQIAARMVGDNVEAQDKALDAGLKALQLPAAADAADLIMHEAGFVSRSDQEAAAQPPAIPASPTPLPASPLEPSHGQ